MITAEKQKKDKISFDDLANVLRKIVKTFPEIMIIEEKDLCHMRTPDNFFGTEEISTVGFYIVRTSGFFFKRPEEMLFYISIIAINAITIIISSDFTELVKEIYREIKKDITEKFNIAIIERVLLE